MDEFWIELRHSRFRFLENARRDRILLEVQWQGASNTVKRELYPLDSSCRACREQALRAITKHFIEFSCSKNRLIDVFPNWEKLTPVFEG